MRLLTVTHLACMGSALASGIREDVVRSMSSANSQLSRSSEAYAEPPPLFAIGRPDPFAACHYGTYGPYENGWNGVYFPYLVFGYNETIPSSKNPSQYLAGPYGFYWGYGADCAETNFKDSHGNTVSGVSTCNKVVPNLYIGGHQLPNGTWANGTYVNETYNNGVYTIYCTQGNYEGGVSFNDTVINGTLVAAFSQPKEFRINVNDTGVLRDSPQNCSSSAEPTFVKTFKGADNSSTSNANAVGTSYWPAAGLAAAFLLL